MLSERVSDGDERDRLMELGFEGDRKKKNHLRSHSTLVGRKDVSSTDTRSGVVLPEQTVEFGGRRLWRCSTPLTSAVWAAVKGSAVLGALPLIFVTCDSAALARGFSQVSTHFSLSSAKQRLQRGFTMGKVCQGHPCDIFESFCLVRSRTE